MDTGVWFRPGVSIPISIGPQERLHSTDNDCISLIKKLAKQNGGLFPSCGWLQNNGYARLDARVRKNPSLLGETEQERLVARVQSRTEIRATIRKLAKQNGGECPSYSWLNKNNHSGLAARIHNNPSLLGKIKQEWAGGQTEEEAVATIKKLAKQNGGLFPTHKWLKEHDLSGLDARVRNNPSLLGKIKQERRSSVNEAKSTIEMLAKQNGGKLQTSSWLKDSGHGGLYCRIRKNPSLLGKIKQEWGGARSDDEIRTTIEMLAKQNGGKLQNPAWLSQNGHSGIGYRIRKNPSLLGRIKQERFRQTEAEAIATIKKLAKQNGGLFPTYKWLKEHDLRGLDGRVRNNPSLLGKTKQERCRQSQWVKSNNTGHTN